jgi:hypothetical protein
MSEFIDNSGERSELRAEVEPYLQRFSHVCANENDRQDLEQLLFTLYVGVNHPQQFLQFMNAFHLSCTSIGDFRRLCSVAVEFTNVWKDKSISNLMTTLVRGRIILRDDTGAMKASGAGIVRLELLVDFLCSEPFVDWFNRGAEDISDEAIFRKFVESSSGFVDLLDWIHDSVSADPRLLHVFVELWKANGMSDCQKFASLYKRYGTDLGNYAGVKYAALFMVDKRPVVAEKFLNFISKKPQVRADDMYREVCAFLEANDERGALDFLDLDRIS